MLRKITNEDKKGKGVVGLPDTPNLTTTEMQEQFDSLANLTIERFNETVDALESVEAGNSGADNIAATVPEGIIALQTVQSILSALAAKVIGDSMASHTHLNKAVLDAISPEAKTQYDNAGNLLKDILAVESVVTDSRTALPTSAAVLALLASYSYTALKETVFPVGAVYFTHGATNPGTFLGGTWQAETLVAGVSSWRRIA